MERSESIKNIVPYRLVFYPFPVHCLKGAASDSEYTSRSISRIVNALRENGYYTIGDILEASPIVLTNTRGFGPKGLEIVMALLIRIYENPGLIREKSNG